MPVDIRKFFNKADAAKKKPSSASSSAAATGGASAKQRAAASSTVADGRPSNKGNQRSPVKPPPRKKTKRLVIGDDTTDEEDGNDGDSVAAEETSKPAAREGTAAAADSSKKKRKSEESRVEMSVDDFFGTSRGDAAASSDKKSPAKKRATSSRNANYGDDDEEADDGGDDGAPISSPAASKKLKKPQHLESPPKSPAKKGSRSKKPPRTSDGDSSSPLLRPSEPYSGEKPLRSDDLKAGCLTGLTFCFTGVLESFSRDSATELVKELGGRVTTAVSSKTDYLVAGPVLEDGRPYEEGSKHKKAVQNGRTVVVVGEPLFFGLLLQLDARARVRAGEPPRLSEDADGAIATGSSPAATSRADPARSLHRIEPPSISVDSASIGNAPRPPATGAASRPAVATAGPVKNPYAATQKLKANPYAKSSSALGMPPPGAAATTRLKAPPPPTLPTKNGAGMLWVDRHKPQSTKQILGNQDSVTKLAAWLRTWETKFNTPNAIGKSFGGKQGPWKAALLSGPPGIGKTTTATLVAREAGRDVIEFNASDVRSKNALQSGLGDITGSRTLEFASKRAGGAPSKHRTKRCVIMDEVDGMGGGDRGGIASLIQLIKHSQVPVICICNDRQAQKIRSLVDYCLDLRFRRPTKTQLAKRAVEIAAQEGLLVEPNAAEAIAESCGNDVRQVINALQMWNKSESATGENDHRMTYKQLKDRQHEINKDEILRLGLFDATRSILEGRTGLGNSDAKAERDSFFKRDNAFFVDYNLVGLMVQQNYLKVVQGDFLQAARVKDDDTGIVVLERMSKAADSMSDYDLVSTTILRSQNWSLLPFASICTVKTGFHASGPTGHFFPGYPEFAGYLGKNSTRTKKFRLLQELQHHANYRVTGGTNELRLTYVPAFRERFLSLLLAREDDGSNNADGIRASVDLMDEYGLDRDDVMEKLNEFSLDPKSTDAFSKMDSKRKAAFTRAYNERSHKSQALVSEQFAGAMKKSGKRGGGGSSSMSETRDLDVIDEDGPAEEEDEEDNDEEDDATVQEKIRKLLKPTRKATASKSNGGKPGGGSGKGGGRGKNRK